MNVLVIKRGAEMFYEISAPLLINKSFELLVIQ